MIDKPDSQSLQNILDKISEIPSQSDSQKIETWKKLYGALSQITHDLRQSGQSSEINEQIIHLAYHNNWWARTTVAKYLYDNPDVTRLSILFDLAHDSFNLCKEYAISGLIRYGNPALSYIIKLRDEIEEKGADFSPDHMKYFILLRDAIRQIQK